MRRRPLLALASAIVLPSAAACSLFATEDPSGCAPAQGTPTSLRSIELGVKASLDLGFAPSLPAAGDFDGDGHIDIAVADPSGGVVTVWSGSGDWNFAMSRTVAAEGNARVVASADLDQDGLADLIIGGSGSPNGEALSDHLRVIYGNADFTSAAVVPYDTDPASGNNSPLGTTSVAVGDMNADGLLDVITGTEEGGGFVFFNEGSQSFGLGQRYEGSGHAAHTILEDLDGDGEPSLITYGRADKLSDDPAVEGQVVTDAFIRAYSMNNGVLTEEPGDTPGTLAQTQAPMGAPMVTVVDFNGDNRPEPVGAFNAALHVYGNVGGRISSDTAHLICMDNGGMRTEVSGLVTTELDQDSTAEIVTLNLLTNDLVIMTVRSGILTAPIHVDAGIPGGEQLASEDVDGDGWPEILVTDPDGNQLHIVAVE